MDERSLRSILLVRAIEETDREGHLLPPADRAEATRAVLREDPALRRALDAPDPTRGFERFLLRRAQWVLGRLVPRHPALATVVSGPERAAGFARLALVGAFLLGLVLSALDRTRLVDVLAFPLAGLVLWNVAVYLLVLVRALRGARPAGATAGAYAAWTRRGLERWVRRSGEFDAPLARALQVFVADWRGLAGPLLAQRAARLFHLAAAVVALGLVAGLYWRGITLEYRAGWESTFLTPDAVRTVLAAVYGPASLLSGIPLPATAADVQALHWRGGAGGVRAAPWIHLLALTAVLWIVLPRLLLALLATLQGLRLARRGRLPPATVAYARELLTGEGVALGARPVEVVPYACEPAADAAPALERVCGAALGGTARVRLRPPVPYGAEEEFVAALRREPPGGDAVAVVCDLASTPEAENHGTLIAALRDAVAGRGGADRMLVVVDSGAYARRMGEGERLVERARTWTEFARGYGLDAIVVDLGRLARESPAEADARVRGALAGLRT